MCPRALHAYDVKPLHQLTLRRVDGKYGRRQVHPAQIGGPFALAVCSSIGRAPLIVREGSICTTQDSFNDRVSSRK